jgi:hypothetical protein
VPDKLFEKLETNKQLLRDKREENINIILSLLYDAKSRIPVDVIINQLKPFLKKNKINV